MNKKLALLIFGVLVLGYFIGTSYGCVFKNVFGMPCPSCGVSRSFQALLRGEVSAAFKSHPMFWYVPLALVWCTFKKPIVSKKADLWCIGILGGVYILLYLIKIF